MSDTEDLSGTVWRAPNGLAAWEVELLTGEQKDPSPSDVRDGDLLTGTLYGNPFTDWPAFRHPDSGNVYFGGLETDGFMGGYGTHVNEWASCVTVTARKPAPAPLLPWALPDAAPYWRHANGGVETAEWLQGSLATVVSSDWQGGYFIPADLIESLRTGYTSAAVRAILDAADAK